MSASDEAAPAASGSDERRQADDEYMRRHGLDELFRELADRALEERPDDAAAFFAEKRMADEVNCEATPRASPRAKTLTILHFNDVYNIEEAEHEPVGGAARFVGRVKELRADDPLVLFSGDAFAPSLMSTVTHGKQMVPVLNAAGVHCACLGNHDLDFGLDEFDKLKARTQFPWLCANVTMKESGQPLGHCQRYKVIDHGGVKVGVMGLVEREWLDTLTVVEEEEIEYTDFVACARELVPTLRAEGADVVIALTHMRLPNDERLMREVQEVDLLLGGHDHDYVVTPMAGRLLLKSGTDFLDLSRVKLTCHYEGKEQGGAAGAGEADEEGAGRRLRFHVERHRITRACPVDSDIAAVVSSYRQKLCGKMDQVIGETEVPLQGKFDRVRTSETNLGNFVCDCMRSATHADVALLNSGTLRVDRVIPAGMVKMRDLVSTLPMMDALMVISITGKQLKTALENGVSQYPRLEGRFPQVSGVSFEFDPSQLAGSRVVDGSMRVGDEEVGDERTYKLVTKEYLVAGKDGYDVFAECPVLVDEEQGPRLPNVVRNHFTLLSAVNGFRTPGSSAEKAVARFKAAIGKLADVYRLRVEEEGRIRVVGKT